MTCIWHMTVYSDIVSILYRICVLALHVLPKWSLSLSFSLSAWTSIVKNIRTSMLEKSSSYGRNEHIFTSMKVRKISNAIMFRGNISKLADSRRHYDLTTYSFLIRIVHIKNSLPVLESSEIMAFNKILDRFSGQRSITELWLEIKWNSQDGSRGFDNVAPSLWSII